MTRTRPDDRALEHLQRLADGWTQTKIARYEGMATSTLHRHLEMPKFMNDAKTTNQLLAIAVAEGWVTVNPTGEFE